MTVDNFKTGFAPLHLNSGSTAKDFSFKETTSPQYCFLETLNKGNAIIYDNVVIQQPVIEPLILLEDKNG